MPQLPPITIGNTEGPHFTQWRIDLLQELLETIIYAYTDTPHTTPTNIHIWYDKERDYHMLKYTTPKGNQIQVQLYKVFTTTLNNQPDWTSCPRHRIAHLATHLRQH